MSHAGNVSSRQVTELLWRRPAAPNASRRANRRDLRSRSGQPNHCIARASPGILMAAPTPCCARQRADTAVRPLTRVSNRAIDGIAGTPVSRPPDSGPRTPPRALLGEVHTLSGLPRQYRDDTLSTLSGTPQRRSWTGTIRIDKIVQDMPRPPASGLRSICA